MNSALNAILLLLVLGCAGFHFGRLRRECKALRQAREVWKTYAIAVETAYDCELEYDDARTDQQVTAALDQGARAAEAATIAVQTLYDMGEYPDAFGSSPFLPSEPAA